MSKVLSGLLCGLVFGAGLAVSGMMNPAKVIGFLDVAGDWDPTLAFVMGGALLVAVPAFYFIPKRPQPLLEKSFSIPTRKSLDAPLIWGFAIFGIGWGLVRYCPGPAVAALGTGLPLVLTFLGAMITGMFVHAITFGKNEGFAPERKPKRVS